MRLEAPDHDPFEFQLQFWGQVIDIWWPKLYKCTYDTSCFFCMSTSPAISIGDFKDGTGKSQAGVHKPGNGKWEYHGPWPWYIRFQILELGPLNLNSMDHIVDSLRNITDVKYINEVLYEAYKNSKEDIENVEATKTCSQWWNQD